MTGAVDESTCAFCPDNSVTLSPASDAIDDCICNKGYQHIVGDVGDDWCTPCAEGKYKDVIGNRLCRSCPAGTYSSMIGLIDALDCNLCGENSWSPSGSNNVTKCSCNAGFYGTHGGTCSTCQKDHWCPGGENQRECPGHSASLQGSSRLDDCICMIGWYGVLASESDSCSTVCGDGIRVGSESCDDENSLSFDGCSATCTIESGWTCDTINQATGLDRCSTICGDGIRVGSEECDDGQTLNEDGCSSTCKVECGFSCSESDGVPESCTATCGDGIRASVEDCDDGNNVSGDGCSDSCTIESDLYVCLALPCETTFCQEKTLIQSAPPVEDLVCSQMDLENTKATWTHPYLELVSLFEVECEYMSYEQPEVSISLTFYDILSQTAVSGSYWIFSEFPDDFAACLNMGQPDSGSCGHLVAFGSDTEATVFANSNYLIVISGVGYYTGYLLFDVGISAEAFSFGLVKNMQTNQDRVVLSWGHDQDLDLWVYDKGDREKQVGWSMDPRSSSIAGGTVTLDIDNWSGLDGPETTKFESLSSGTVEVWVNHYDNRFTASQIRDAPAVVDIFCYRCLDDHNAVKVGFVTSVTQKPGDVPITGRNWWKVGEFTAPSSTERVKWTTCKSGCYVQAGTADLSSTRSHSNVSHAGVVPKVSRGFSRQVAVLRNLRTQYVPRGRDLRFSRRSLSTQSVNVSTGACVSYSCTSIRDGILPGMTVSCSVRTLMASFGWSDRAFCSLRVLGSPSAPRRPSIEHRASRDVASTQWCFAWSSPVDHGDQRRPGTPDQARILGYELSFQCGEQIQALSVANVLSVCLHAEWIREDFSRQCDSQEVAQQFQMISEDFPAFVLPCGRGEDVSFDVKANNDLFTGAASKLTSMQAMGLPAPVTNLDAVENVQGLSLTWTEVR